MSRQLLRIAQIWEGSIVQEETLRKERPVVVGASSKADFVLATPGDTDATLLTPSGGGYTLSSIGEMTGTFEIGGKKVSLEKGGSVTLSAGDWGMAHIGGVTFYFQYVEDEALPVGAGPMATFDYHMTSSLAFTTAVHVMFLLIAFLLFDPTLQRGELDFPDRFVNILAGEPPDLFEEPEEEDPDDSAAEAAAGEEGEVGEEELEDDTILPEHDAPLVEEMPELAQAMDMIDPESSLARLFTDDNSLALDLGADFMTAGEGDVFEMGAGSSGLGRAGSGGGGGGEGFGAVGGVGQLNTGGGTGTGAGLGRRAERRVGRVQAAGPSQVSGFLSREQIEQVVRRHNRGLRACYETELQRDPDLGGRVTANWTIGLDGRVQAQSVIENTTGNRNMESCILREISRMRFPQPDGGMVTVAFPFNFRSAD